MRNVIVAALAIIFFIGMILAYENMTVAQKRPFMDPFNLCESKTMSDAEKDWLTWGMCSRMHKEEIQEKALDK